MSTSKTTLILCSVGFFVLGAVAALVGEHLLYKPTDLRDTMQTIAVMKDWRMSCPPRTQKDGTCVLDQTIVQRGSNNPLAQLTIGQRDKGDVLAIIAPLGVLITPGLRFSVGTGQPIAIPYKTCLPAGCVATVPLDAALSTAMTQNAGGQITVVAVVGKPIPLNFSLRGLPDALAARAADMKARKEH